MDSTPLRDHLRTLARYHAWATRRLLDGHVAPLPEADYRRPCGLFFGSVHGTLNHLLVGEGMLWWRRFADGTSPQLALDAEAEPDRAALRDRLLGHAEAWEPFVAQLGDERLRGTLDYVTTRGVAQSLPFAATLAHVFNHGTHHRGQVTAGITLLGHPCPEIDLVWMLQHEARTT